MTYIDLINQFWRYDAVQSFSSTDTRLYFLLLKHANNACMFTANSSDHFTQTNRRLAADCDISERVLIEAKRSLKNRGLIDYTSSNKKGDVTKYYILGLQKVTPSVTPLVTPSVTPLVTQTVTPLGKPLNRYKDKDKDSIESTVVDSMSDVPPDAQNSENKEINYEKLVSWFNENTRGVFGKIVMPLSDKRKGMIRARIKEYGKDKFCLVFEKALKSDFLKGQGNKGFVATFDWIIKPSNFEKILSGNYDNKNLKTTKNDANNRIFIPEGIVYEPSTI